MKYTNYLAFPSFQRGFENKASMSSRDFPCNTKGIVRFRVESKWGTEKSHLCLRQSEGEENDSNETATGIKIPGPVP